MLRALTANLRSVFGFRLEYVCGVQRTRIRADCASIRRDKPEVSTDGLAMHLAIAADIANHHAFTFDFRQFIWALMPMGADYCYALAYMLGGENAARLLNLVMLGSIAVSGLPRGSRVGVEGDRAFARRVVCIRAAGPACHRVDAG